MCGIAGIIGEPGADYSSELRAMTDALRHRGPDAEGHHCDVDNGVFLGHRRLSILDLSERANQPMASEDERLVVVFNGEIYNFVELRQELERNGCTFRTTSDTEVILHAYSVWGKDCFRRFRGMFAIGLYDTEKRELLLVRDPLGIKPLYYLDKGGVFSFASEAHVLWRSAPGGKDLQLDYEQIKILLAHGYLPDSGHTIIKGIRKVPPGTILTFNANGKSSERFWTLKKDPEWEKLSFEEGCERFEHLFKDTIRIMLRSDVPLSFLLSGGLDSSFVVAMAGELGMSDLRTFTAVFGHPLDEGEFAKQVATHYGAKHEELRIDVGDVAEDFKQIMPFYDDLSSMDGGLFTTALVSRKIAEHGIKVTFVGEGSDEIFGGYSWFGISQLPFKWMNLGLRALGYYYATTRLMRLRYWWNSKRVAEAFRQSGEKDIFRQVSACEINMQLPNNILPKVDRGTMCASVEARVPYMDHEVVTAAYSMPAKWKRRGQWFDFKGVQEKYILRTLVEQRLPKEIAWRKKRGFLLPISNLLIENRAFVREVLLAPDSLTRDFMKSVHIEKMINFRNTMYHPIEKEKEVIVWRLLLLSLWYRDCFKAG